MRRVERHGCVWWEKNAQWLGLYNMQASYSKKNNVTVWAVDSLILTSILSIFLGNIMPFMIEIASERAFHNSGKPSCIGHCGRTFENLYQFHLSFSLIPSPYLSITCLEFRRVYIPTVSPHYKSSQTNANFCGFRNPKDPVFPSGSEAKHVPTPPTSNASHAL